MSLGDLVLRARGRAVWRDPARTLLTLESFARTEADGGRDIASRRAARRPTPSSPATSSATPPTRCATPSCSGARAAELRAAGGAPAATPSGGEVAADSAYDLSRGRPATRWTRTASSTSACSTSWARCPTWPCCTWPRCAPRPLFRVHRDLTRDDARHLPRSSRRSCATSTTTWPGPPRCWSAGGRPGAGTRSGARSKAARPAAGSAPGSASARARAPTSGASCCSCSTARCCCPSASLARRGRAARRAGTRRPRGPGAGLALAPRGRREPADALARARSQA